MQRSKNMLSKNCSTGAPPFWVPARSDASYFSIRPAAMPLALQRMRLSAEVYQISKKTEGASSPMA